VASPSEDEAGGRGVTEGKVLKLLGHRRVGCRYRGILVLHPHVVVVEYGVEISTLVSLFQALRSNNTTPDLTFEEILEINVET